MLLGAEFGILGVVVAVLLIIALLMFIMGRR